MTSRMDNYKSCKLMMTQHKVGSSQYRMAKLAKKIIDYEDMMEEAQDSIRGEIDIPYWTKILEHSTKKLSVWKGKKTEFFQKLEQWQRENPCY